MARRRHGQVLRRQTGKGITWALRFRAYGVRRYLTLGSESDGWSQGSAEEELQSVLVDVRRGTWIPPTRTGGSTTEEENGPEGPDFHRFASDWLAGRVGEISDSSLAYYRWALRYHLLPYFAGWGVREIDVEAVDEYRRFKVAQSEGLGAVLGRTGPTPGRRAAPARTLSPATINKTIEVLQGVLSLAVEYGHVDRNPASGRRRRLKVPPRTPVHLDTIEQIEALLEAARRLDAKATSKTTDRLPLVGVLVLGGLRAGEVCALRWRDIDLANGRLGVGRSKTPAGIRQVSLPALLRDHLDAHMARTGEIDPDAYVFPNGNGGSRDRANLRSRVLAPVLLEADRILSAGGHPPLPRGVTPHSLRHTFASVLVACGEDPASVMAQLGHTDPRFTLRVYAHLLARDANERGRLKALVQGSTSDVDGEIGGRSSASGAG